MEEAEKAIESCCEESSNPSGAHVCVLSPDIRDIDWFSVEPRKDRNSKWRKLTDKARSSATLSRLGVPSLKSREGQEGEMMTKSSQSSWIISMEKSMRQKKLREWLSHWTCE